MSNHGTMVLEVRELLSGEGYSPFRSWFDSLDAHAAAKVVTATARMEGGNL